MEATTVSAATRTMTALVQQGTGSADVLHLREVAVPAIAAERALLKVRAASVNAADYHSVHGGWLLTLMGMFLRRRDPEPIRGIDVAGVVEAVGADVTMLRPGDEVFGMGRGTWAEYATAPARLLLPKPRQLSFAEAGAIGVAGITALQALRDHGRVQPGQRVLIYGAGGGVGTFAVQIAKALGAHVTAVTGAPNIELIRPLGADEVVDYTTEDVGKRKQRYDVVVDIAGIRSFRDLRRMLVPGGTLVVVGAAKRGGWLGIFARLLAAVFRARVLKQRVIMFIAQSRRDDLAFLGQLAEAGTLHPIIDRVFTLERSREAVRYAMTGQGRAKVVIEVSR